MTNDRRHEGAPHRADFCDRNATHSGYYVSETIAEICRCGAAAVGASLVRQAPRPLIVATGNPGRLRAFGALLSDLTFQLHRLAVLRVASPEETGTTFLENALLTAT